MTKKNITSETGKKLTLGIVGVRGYVGKELLKLLINHPDIQLSWVSSRQLAGRPMSSIIEPLGNALIESLSPEEVAAKATDIIVLALPNGLAHLYVNALEQSNQSSIIIDLSADYRFDKNWHYCLPEIDGSQLGTSAQQTTVKPIKISNPGCYSTAMQLALAPVVQLMSAPPACFGVSGYSGAGTKPCANNDPENLSDNLLGYSLLEHLHEKEVSVRLQHPVHFSPHVAAFFRGINMTIQIQFKSPQTISGLLDIYQQFYADFPLIKCQQAIPTIQQVINTPDCIIGGFTISHDGQRATIVSCLDNLLKGAASQALQNINISLGLAPYSGLLTTTSTNSNMQQHTKFNQLANHIPGARA